MNIDFREKECCYCKRMLPSSSFRILEEIRKCDVVCCWCHVKRTVERENV
jgi:hypothetical protein